MVSDVDLMTSNIRKTKGQLPWRKDPSILKRMVDVEDRHLNGLSNVQIARELGFDEITVRRDLKRIYQLWGEHYAADIDKRKQRSIGVLRRVQRKAWREYELTHISSQNKPRYLGEVRQAEDSIAKILGLFIEKHEVTGEIGIRRYVGVDPSDV